MTNEDDTIRHNILKNAEFKINSLKLEHELQLQQKDKEIAELKSILSDFVSDKDLELLRKIDKSKSHE